MLLIEEDYGKSGNSLLTSGESQMLGSCCFYRHLINFAVHAASQLGTHSLNVGINLWLLGHNGYITVA